MSTSKTKRAARPASRLLAGGLVSLAMLILVGASVYSRPSTTEQNFVSASVATTATNNNEVIPSGDPVAATDFDRKSKPAKPPAPAAPPPPADPAAPPAPATPMNGVVRPAPNTPPAPPAPVSEGDKLKQKSQDKVEKGGLIEAPPPVYPEEAKKDKIEGLVTVAIVIGEDGNVVSAKAKSGPEALHGAAEVAAAKARFKPTTLNGKPAKVSGAMSYNFVLDKKE